MLKVYIYGLKCPEKGIVRYVGKSKNPKKRLQNNAKE
jgi:excinuclease UvrABC nuclease subunit